MTRFRMFRTLVAFGLLVLSAGAARAQVFTPTFLPPILTNNVGIYVSDFDPGDLAVEGIWRRGVYGIRAGYVDLGDGSLSVGGEVSNLVYLEGAPIGLLFSAAGQALVGDANWLGVQGGFSAGHTFAPQGANFTFTPYLHPRLALTSALTEGDDELELEALAELGFQLAFAPNLMVRFAANLGDGPNWGVGFAWRQ